MKHVGQTIRDARLKRGMSLLDVEQKTKIKRQYISDIERGNWANLPDYTVVCGFVRNLSALLGLDPSKTAAFLKRDYPLPKESAEPKPDIQEKFSISPKLAFTFGVFAVMILVSAYIFYQYKAFHGAPELIVHVPIEGQAVNESVVKVLGTTDENSTLTVNDQPVVVQADGSFIAEINLPENMDQLIIKSSSRSGKETVVVRKINTEKEEN